MEQLDLFGTATPVTTTPATPAPPADVQLSLFRPDFRAVRAPKSRKPAAPVTLDPALHGATLI
ncbi:hypothetical protein ACIBTV_27655 [Micromonospora sp. NPDC049366]|uniref:hypothetical protein n=1 Tax=Micromonospora sp. NPDC049366 TaxID=3364271 RepID=UPI00379D0CAF